MGAERTAFSGEVEAEKEKVTFLERIGRPELAEKLTHQHPIVYSSMEVAYGNMPFSGGLGVLAGDILLQAAEHSNYSQGIPLEVLVPAYPYKVRQKIEGLRQTETHEDITLADLGMGVVKETSVNVGDQKFPVYLLREMVGSVGLNGIYVPAAQELYYGGNNDPQRLFQQVAAGFCGQEFLVELGIEEPSVIQLNESANTLLAVAHMDWLVGEKGLSVTQALEKTRAITVYTNHTLVPAADSAFDGVLVNKYVFPNIKSDEVLNWLRAKMNEMGGKLDLTLLALDIAGKYNGVSKLHSQIARDSFRKLDGSQVPFEPVTNGVFLGRWTPAFREYYRTREVLDSFDLPKDEGLGIAIESMDVSELSILKQRGKESLRRYLREERVDQYGEHVDIPVGANIITWARRIAGYKRLGMMFERPDELSHILLTGNAHFLMAGKAHKNDYAMKDEHHRILEVIDKHPVLKERVHFIEDYDEALSIELINGSDIAINCPKVGEEACGTSWEKYIAACTILISTHDGGVADNDYGRYHRIEGDEVSSLYYHMRAALGEVGDTQRWNRVVKDQLHDYLPIIAGGRMIGDYVQFMFPKAA